MTASLELQNLRKAFDGLVAVDGVSLQVPPGAIFGLLGPNGAGKTTTLRMVMDILAPDSGEILFFGRPRSRRDLARVGYLPEERGLYRKMQVREHLLFLAALQGVRRRAALAAAEGWLDRLGLSAWSGRRVEELSKGMQQKVQLLATFLHDPEIVILDEPFSGLDPLNQGLFKEILKEYRQRGRTVVFSTHVLEQAEKLCDQICLISHGRTLLHGPVEKIKRRFGGRAWYLEADGDLGRLAEVPGVERAIPGDGSVKLLLEEGAAGPQVLRELVRVLEVREFRYEEPSLEEIFVKVVRDAG